jgi:tRNA threonylcarbamoyladenosine biosynthesis protein TsaB
MKALALDTATPIGTLALVDQGRELLAESRLPAGEPHSKRLMPEISRMFFQAGMSINDVDLIAVGLGPGSFTGLRIGMAAAKGLALASGKPLVGVGTLDTLARSFRGAHDGPICVVIDARKNQLYAAFFCDTPKGCERAGEERTYTTDSLIDAVKGPTLFLGPGLERCESELTERLGGSFIRGPKDLDTPKAVVAAELAFDLFDQGVETDPALILPRYIRPPDIREPKQ